MSLAALPSVVLIPPLNLLAAACVGAVFHRRRVGRVLLGLGLAGLVLLSLPLVAGLLLTGLERGLVLAPPSGDPPQAIVILSGDEADIVRDGRLAERVGHLTLEREVAGAALARRTQLPVLVTGGSDYPGDPPLASLMAQSMAQDFAVAPKWSETRSQDTWQNAQDSAAMLRAAGIHSVYVVTHAWHERRALIAFRAAGLVATPAPVPLDAPPRWYFHNLLPHVSGWQESYFAIHEWLGIAWYSLRA
jgi:uncharacterized SAM-binding protein YcdF (DUF218 family)